MGGYIFTLCVCPHLGGGGTRSRSGWGGVPHPADGGGVPRQGGYPSSRGGVPWWGGTPAGGVPWWWGVPRQGVTQQWGGTLVGGTLAGGYPGGGVPQKKFCFFFFYTACTCYTAGGIPLAFTQEDFLVYICGCPTNWFCSRFPVYLYELLLFTHL